MDFQLKLKLSGTARMGWCERVASLINKFQMIFIKNMWMRDVLIMSLMIFLGYYDGGDEDLSEEELNEDEMEEVDDRHEEAEWEMEEKLLEWAAKLEGEVLDDGELILTTGSLYLSMSEICTKTTSERQDEGEEMWSDVESRGQDIAKSKVKCKKKK
ncbi:unnamed protein product [Blepharisma stoltei]|uniref:Uncharacterized protein n=1 Tax=Blepharisma stoltei TaxID=1481888 RepID=A0AAU9J3V7_9CILI|nr:unnamed protein product [Blepharisma stoltei]